MALQWPEFKALKDEKHASSRRGRSTKTNVTRSSTRTSNEPAPTCAEILGQEIKKIREQKPELSNFEFGIRN